MKTTHILSIVMLSLASLGLGWWSLTVAPSTPPGDLSYDKVSDLAIGVPDEGIPDSVPITYHAGAINVLFGRRLTGLTTDLDQYLYEGKSTVDGAYQEYDRFGSALAIGDFNCDGIGDLAVGVPGQDVNSQDGAGAVHIFYGALLGLSYGSPLDDFIIDDNWTCMTASTPEAGDNFGSALASGDFDGDGCSDLAIGVPNEDWSGAPNAGLVYVIYGSSYGFISPTCDAFRQDLLQETYENGDHFGAALVAGNFGTDAYDDLAIGAPDESFADPIRSYVGVVHVVYGGSDGLLANVNSNQLWYQGHNGLDGTPQEADRFGAAMAAGNFDGYGGDDLAIGVPGQDVSGFEKSGAVHIIYSNVGNLTSLDDQLIDQSSFYISVDDPQPWADENFGAALAAGDFNGDSFIDLAVGIPYDYQGVAGEACGGVDVLYGASGALNTTAAQEWSQFDPTVNGACEEDDEFGAALAAGNFDHNAYADLVVGVPGENDDTGYIQVLYGTSAGITAAGNLLWSQDTGTIDGTAENGDRFGAALAAVPVLNFQVYLPLTMR